jgi:hypothetical protein
MDGGSGSGCGCCSCGCLGCLAPFIAIIMVIMMIFAIFAPMNRDFEHMIPDNFQEYYPDFNDGTSIPTDKGSVMPCYQFSESSVITSRGIPAEF